MRNPHKRLTVSLPADLVEHLDRASRRLGTTRSGLVEEWLRRGARMHGHNELERQIEAYYSGRNPAEMAEDQSITAAAGRIARRLRIDEAARRGIVRRRRPPIRP